LFAVVQTSCANPALQNPCKILSLPAKKELYHCLVFVKIQQKAYGSLSLSPHSCDPPHDHFALCIPREVAVRPRRGRAGINVIRSALSSGRLRSAPALPYWSASPLVMECSTPQLDARSKQPRLFLIYKLSFVLSLSVYSIYIRQSKRPEPQTYPFPTRRLSPGVHRPPRLFRLPLMCNPSDGESEESRESPSVLVVP